MALRSKKQSNVEYVNPFEVQGYLARIVQIIDMGKQPQTDWKTGEEKEPKHEVMFTFEIPDVLNDEGNPRWLSKRYAFPQSWPEKSGLKNTTNLYQLFSTFALGSLKQLDKYPAYYFFDDDVWDILLGSPVYLDVVETNTGRPKVKSVSKPPKFGGKVVEVAPLANPATLFDAGTSTVESWNQLYDWVQKIILKALDEETSAAAYVLANEAEASKEKEEPKEDKKEEANNPDFDDDIPF